MNFIPEYVIIPKTSFDIIRLASLDRFEQVKKKVMEETDPEQLRHRMKYFCALQNAINDIDFNGVAFQPKARNICFASDAEELDPDAFASIDDSNYEIALNEYEENHER